MAKINRSKMTKEAFSTFYHSIEESFRRADFGRETPDSRRDRSKYDTSCLDIIVTSVLSAICLAHDLGKVICPSKYDYTQ